MAGTSGLKTSQQVINEMAGYTGETLQRAINRHNGTSGKQITEAMKNATVTGSDKDSLQKILYYKLASTLGLTKPFTNYSEQWLLNAAQINGISLTTILQ